jgi:ferric-dicitrate binding protein FerR (iron transport regulator)
MDKDLLELLAKKYFDGTASIAEKELLSKWYDIIHLSECEDIYVDNAETADQVKQRIFNSITQKLQPEEAISVKPKHFFIKHLMWAASIAAIVTLGFFIFKPNLKIGTIKTTNNQVVNVPLNRVLHITLPDGSRVWLKAGSVFMYPSHFTAKCRQVELVEGQAFFDVKHQTNHPFIVKTKKMNVTVLGTSFDVRNYKKEGETRVSVITGKVGVTMPNSINKKAIFLLPEQEAVLSTITNHLVKQPAHKTIDKAWFKNNTMFDQENLENVFKALEKEYNTTIIVENKKLLNERISIVLGSQRLDSIMQVLSFAKHFKYQIANDSTVVIR